AADVSAARLAWAVRHGVDPKRAVADFRVALDEVDAVDIVTSADSHYPVARACLAAGRHCFVEKPLARTAAEGRELEAAAEAAGLQRDFLGRGLDDLSVTVIHYGDVPAIVEANYFVPGTWRDCVIVGERGTLVADYAVSVVTLFLGEHRKHAGAWEAVETGK